jgi:hypothetical protein
MMLRLALFMAGMLKALHEVRPALQCHRRAQQSAAHPIPCFDLFTHILCKCSLRTFWLDDGTIIDCDIDEVIERLLHRTDSSRAMLFALHTPPVHYASVSWCKQLACISKGTSHVHSCGVTDKLLSSVEQKFRDCRMQHIKRVNLLSVQTTRRCY